jgi:hypothetical protein
MIGETLEQVALALNDYLQARFSQVGELAILSNITKPDGTPVIENMDTVALTLIHIQEERALQRATKFETGTAPVYINLYVLFSAHYTETGSYRQALDHLTGVIGFFQSNPVLTKQNVPTLPTRVEKLVPEFVNQEMQNAHFVWSMLGAKHAPSVMYKIRMIVVDDEQGFSPSLFTGLSSNP